MSRLRVCLSMNTFRGAAALVRAWSTVSSLRLSGCSTVVLISRPTGAMTKNVSTRARLMSTWLEGVWAVPMPWRTKPRTMMIRVKQVVVSRMVGAMVRTVSSSTACRVELRAGPWGVLPKSTVTVGRLAGACWACRAAPAQASRSRAGARRRSLAARRVMTSPASAWLPRPAPEWGW